GARLSGSVSWNGDLESLGVIGAKASVSVRMTVVDLSTNLTVGGQTLVSEECETFIVFDSCLRRITGSRAVNLPFQAQRGREYEIRFNLTCESNSGGVGDANCIFNENGAFPFAGGGVSRTDLTLNVEADIVGLLEEIRDDLKMLKDDLAAHDADIKAQIGAHDAEIKAQLAEHDARLAEHEAAEAERFAILMELVDRNFSATLESIRLLLTPQGRRATDLPVCDGEPCAFPHGANAGSIGACDNGNGNGNCGNGQSGDTGGGDAGGSDGGDSASDGGTESDSSRDRTPTRGRGGRN
ncbi:MAG: hypothetical protein OER88_08325, partial [Planctomycetota bacterium]|nr:hypothetical protein [Planctomycetota bacterium]